FIFFFSSRRRHTRLQGDWSSDVCSSDRRVTGALPRDPVRLLLLSLRNHGERVPAGLEQNQSAQEIPHGTSPEPLRIVLAPFYRDNPYDFRRSDRRVVPPESRRPSVGSAFGRRLLHGSTGPIRTKLPLAFP